MNNEQGVLAVPLPPTTRASATVVPFRTLVRQREVVEEVSDHELLRRCRERDSAAWDTLVSRYQRLVYSVAVRNGLNAEDAADVTQATFVALIDGLDRIRDDEKLSSWLMTVARRQSWRIRNRNRNRLDIDVLAETSEDPLGDWDAIVALHSALGELGGPCKTLLEALYLDADAPSYSEIAERLGRSIGGIGPLRGRCLDKMRSILSEDGAW